MHRFLPVLLCLPLLGCPTGDDDDSATPDTGDAPVITSVSMCEVSGSRAECFDNGGSGMDLAFDVQVTDVDGDLQNPQVFFRFEGQAVWSDAFIEQDLGSGGGIRLTLPCYGVEPGTTLAYEFAIRDAAANESEAATGTYEVRADAPTFGQPGACPAM